MKQHNYNRVIWIVGASSGIGESLVGALNTPGTTIFISARNKKALEAVAHNAYANVEVLPLDITDEISVQQAADFIRNKAGRLDQVIINAGTCEYIDSYKIDIAALKRVMDTNFLGALNVINVSLPLLRAALSDNPEQSPQLAVMSSSVTYQALPRAGAYGASKAALRYFVESLKLDLQHEGIDIRVISPGFVKTPLTDKNDFDMPFIVEADEAAKRIVNGLKSNKFDIHFPSRFTRILKAIALLPDALRFKLVGSTSRHMDQHTPVTNDNAPFRDNHDNNVIEIKRP